MEEVHAAVGDWHAMRGRSEVLIGMLDADPPAIDPAAVEESKQFLSWLADDHFTFLGYREYELITDDDEVALKALPDPAWESSAARPDAYTGLTPKALALRDAAPAGADQGQLALDGPPPRLPRLHRRQALWR